MFFLSLIMFFPFLIKMRDTVFEIGKKSEFCFSEFYDLEE